jgi:GH18 family chitinase
VAIEMGVAVILTIGRWGDGKFFSGLSTDAKKRSEFIDFLFATMEKFSADGIYLEWVWPGCPDVRSFFK